MAKARTRALKLTHEAFVRAYLANGGNATEAYHAVFPKASRTTCATEGWTLLRIPKIYAQIQTKWEQALAKQRLDPDAVIGMVACEARADMTQLYDADGKMLPPSQWPKWMTHCVEAVDMREDGTAKIKLTGQSQARKFLLELSGRTRNAVADSIDHMADAILADRAKHLKETS